MLREIRENRMIKTIDWGERRCRINVHITTGRASRCRERGMVCDVGWICDVIDRSSSSTVVPPDSVLDLSRALLTMAKEAQRLSKREVLSYRHARSRNYQDHSPDERKALRPRGRSVCPSLPHLQIRSASC